MPCFWNCLVVFCVATSLTTHVQAMAILNSTTEGIDSMGTEVTTKPTTSGKDIILGSCIWAIGRTCPDKDVAFHLYTRQNPEESQLIYIDSSFPNSNLSDSNFNSRDPSKIIIHGYNANMNLHALAKMKNEYLAKGDYNVFYVDWSTLAKGPCYVNAVYNIQHIGTCVAQLVERIRDMQSSDIHVIGFSLGAHIANYIAKNVQNFTLPRITGLDPALPLFVTSPNDEKLDKTDAAFVDVIHTNALVQGKFERCGHADFYMNGGIFQPNCFRDNPLNPFPCFHHRALDYYLESIRTEKGFWGWPCSSYFAYVLGECPRTNYLAEVGENMSNTTKGMFFVETNGDSPYAMGKWTESIKPNNNSVDMNLNYESIIEATDDMETSSSRVERLLISTNQWEKLNYHFNDPYSGTKGNREYRLELHGVEGNQERATIASSSDDDVLFTTENPFSKSFWNELSKGRKDVL
ncbi:pancreatic lipase-related protein 2 [Musca domestica]|uniref:Pancreatic lipase-related protein 2 n=1 Tax=Musca domestica TaxID=7370 RepID=A0A9J7CW96_MUSDO|nr:pancreatic lipase-related protein 2 [Musca domestica]XP_019893432.2 pancreatic lipase-related protein 2 [Musca domestica]